MKSKGKWLIYSVLFIAFIVSFVLMLFFGKETFLVVSNNSSAEEYRYHFVLIPEEIDNAYWRYVEKGAKETANVHQVFLDYSGPQQANTEEYLRTIDQAIAGRVDGIIAQGVDDPSFVELVQKANNLDIPFITIDSDHPNSPRRAYVGTNNYYAGFIAGKDLITNTIGRQYVGIITGHKEAIHLEQRVQGFKAAISQEPRIQVLAIEESNITETGAVQATYNLMRKHRDLNAIFGTTALDGIGIARVFRNMYPQDDPYIISFDTLPETLELIENGEVDATVAQYPYDMGAQAVEVMVDLLEGKKISELQYTDTDMIHKEDLSPDFQPNRKGNIK